MRFKVGTFFSIPLYIHWTFFIIISIFLLNPVQELIQLGTISLQSAIPLGAILGVFFFVTLHEYGHCFAAQYFDLEVRDITLYLFGGAAAMHFDFKKPIVEFWIAIAGPAVNLFFMCIFFLLFHVLVPPYQFVVAFLFTINAMLFAFNLFLPIFPMDGGRVFRSLLHCALGDVRKATLIAVKVSQFLAVTLAVVALYFGFYLAACVLVFTIFLAQSEMELFNLMHVLKTIKSNLALVLQKPELEHATIEEIVEELNGIEDEKTKKLIGRDNLLTLLTPLTQNVE